MAMNAATIYFMTYNLLLHAPFLDNFIIYQKMAFDAIEMIRLR